MLLNGQYECYGLSVFQNFHFITQSENSWLQMCTKGVQSVFVKLNFAVKKYTSTDSDREQDGK